MIIQNEMASTALIQRKLSIGYGKAEKYIDMMQEMGIVGKPNICSYREVKMTLEDWQNYLKKALENA